MESIGLPPDWNGLDFFDLDSATEPPVTDVLQYQASHPSTLEQTFVPSQLKLIETSWQALAAKVNTLQEMLPDFRLPSRHAMSRYFQSYAEQFQHYPMIHLPTYDPGSMPLFLTLAITASGARYRLEPKNAYSLYRAATALTLEQRRIDSLQQYQQMSDAHSIAMIQSLILLMSYGCWDRDAGLLEPALDLQTVTSRYVRISLRSNMPPHETQLPWSDWVAVETHRRTILIAFAYLVIQSVAYDLPPVVLISEIQALQLPCEPAIWDARIEEEWKVAVRRFDYTPSRISDILSHLLDDTVSYYETVLRVSSDGMFIVLLALTQRIAMVRSLQGPSSSLPPADLESLQ